MKKPTFLTDAAITASWVWSICYYLCYWWAKAFHNWTIANPQNLPNDDEPALFCGFHSSHNQDILAQMFAIHEWTSRVPRGLFHRQIIQFFPILKNIGGTAGQRETAEQLLQQGHLVGVIPGGGEEAMRGHENAYTVDWRSATGRQRRGFAQVAINAAKQTGRPVKVIPIFIENAEEMRFNPIIYTLNLIGFTRAWSCVDRWLSASAYFPTILYRVWSMFCMSAWWWAALIALPVPVQVTTHLGDAVLAKPDSSVEEVANAVQMGMKNLIATHQVHGHSYEQGVMKRLDSSSSADFLGALKEKLGVTAQM